MSDPSPIFRAGGATAFRARRTHPNICGWGARGKTGVPFLRRKGYRILYRGFRAPQRWRSRHRLSRRDTLVFVEVKTRTREDFGRPVEAVNAAKRKLISRGALAWLQLLDNPDILVRFDVVEIVLAEDGQPRFELIRDAFPLSRPLRLLASSSCRNTGLRPVRHTGFQACVPTLRRLSRALHLPAIIGGTRAVESQHFGRRQSRRASISTGLQDAANNS